MIRGATWVVALTLALGAAACGDGTPETPIDPTVFQPRTVDVEKVREAAAVAALVRENQERGWDCGYHLAWEEVLDDARHKAPLRWRSKATAGAWGTGLIFLLIGVIGTFVLAWSLPRWRLRRAKRPKKATTGWIGFFQDLLGRIVRGLGRALRVEQFDRAALDARVTAICECREAERQLAQAVGARVFALSAAAPAPASSSPSIIIADDAADTVADVAAEAAIVAEVGHDAAEANHDAVALEQGLAAWREELAGVRRRLEDSTEWSASDPPGLMLPKLKKARRAAQQLRLELTRFEIEQPGVAPADASWRAWVGQLDQRPKLALAPTAKEVPGWVRPVGWAGVAGLMVSLVMTAMWATAGGFPFFIAFLASFASVTATVVARVHLFQGGRIPLLPGLADRLASWLTTLTVITTIILFASNMTSTESGLDLGDAPPVEAPSAETLKVPVAPARFAAPKP